jgi:hypothetical protein
MDPAAGSTSAQILVGSAFAVATMAAAAGTSTATSMVGSDAAAPVTRPPLYLPPIPLPRNVVTAHDRELQQAIKAWADNATRIINDLVSRI